MKKRLMIFWGLVIIILVFVFLCDPCKNKPPKTDICFVVGNTRNVKQISANILQDEIWYAMENNSTYSVIVIDGNPNEISNSGQMTTSKRIFIGKDNNQKILNNRLEEISTCIPNDEEIDILAALNCASKSIDKNADNKKIVIYSSGISTAGELNFAQDPELIYDDPLEIVELLKSRQTLPDLSNIEIVWYGLNHVEGEQKELGAFELYKLKNLWGQILQECGVKFENINEIFNEKPPQTLSTESAVNKADLPKVSTAEIRGIPFSIEDFNFKPGTSILQNKEMTIEILKPIVQDIKNAGYPQFYVIGSTASADSHKDCIELSLERAKVIKNMLSDLGIPESCLKIYGIGREYIDDNYRWRVNDLTSNGKLDPVLSQQNRKVMLIPSDSSSGNDFINDYNKYFN